MFYIQSKVLFFPNLQPRPARDDNVRRQFAGSDGVGSTELEEFATCAHRVEVYGAHLPLEPSGE